MNNRIVGIIGSALLILGVFLPIISLMGLLTFSLFTFIQGFPTGPGGGPMPDDAAGMFTLFRIIGIVVLLLGAGSLLLALKNQFKALIGTGVVALCLLVLIFIKLQSLFSTAPAEARAMISVGFGFYVMVLGAIGLIVAGVMKSPVPVTTPGWNPPPPPPYPPGH